MGISAATSATGFLSMICLSREKARALSRPGLDSTQRRAGLSVVFSALLIGRLQHQLLHAPRQQLADIKCILVRTGDFVNPGELAGRTAAIADAADQFAIERQLVDFPRD